MPLRLQNKLALVTAAGQGIGRAIAEMFASEGARVIATDLDDKKLEGLKSLKRRKLDVRSTASVDSFAHEIATELGALDVLVNCAGYVHHGNVLDCSEHDWDFSFDLNVKSMHRTIKAFVPGMLGKQAGSIVNISSAVSSIRGVPDRYVYGATKAAVIGLTKAVAADFIKKGIRANAICPRSNLRRSRSGSRIVRARPVNRSRRSKRLSSNANLWVGSDMPRRSPRSRLSLPPMRPATSRAKRIWSTAGWRSRARNPYIGGAESWFGVAHFSSRSSEPHMTRQVCRSAIFCPERPLNQTVSGLGAVISDPSA